MAKKTIWSWMEKHPFDPEERIRDIAMGNAYDSMNLPDSSDPSYFRAMASQIREYEHEPRTWNGYPSPSDLENPTAEDMEEQADELECGFEGGEFV